VLQNKEPEQLIWSQISEVETLRWKSTVGFGFSSVVSTEALQLNLSFDRKFKNLASEGNVPLTFNLPSEVTLTGKRKHQPPGHTSESSGLENAASCFSLRDQGCVCSHNSDTCVQGLKG